jgi:cytochrome d ubiquinol oxidase subunit I
VRATFEAHSADLGFAFLLKRYVDDPREATESRSRMAAEDTSRPSGRCSGRSGSWSGSASLHRGDGLFLLPRLVPADAVPALALYAAASRSSRRPWIAAELGWFVAEFGRQPWTVDGVLPTALSVSHLSVADLLITLAGFVTFYSSSSSSRWA